MAASASRPDAHWATPPSDTMQTHERSTGYKPIRPHLARAHAIDAPIGTNISAVSAEAQGNRPQVRPAGAALFSLAFASVLRLSSCAAILPSVELRILRLQHIRWFQMRPNGFPCFRPMSSHADMRK